MKLSENNLSDYKYFNVTKVAKIISFLIHPFFVSVAYIAILIYLDTGLFYTSISWAGLYSLFVLVPVFIYMFYKITKGHFTDMDISVRKERRGLYIIGGLFLLLYYFAVIYKQAPHILFVLVSTGLAMVISFAFITHFWTKISVHSGTIVGFAVSTIYYSLPVFLYSIAIALLVTWSRLSLSQHSLNQIFLSWTISAAWVLVMFSWLL
jgi:hypothetical protein